MSGFVSNLRFDRRIFKEGVPAVLKPVRIRPKLAFNTSEEWAWWKNWLGTRDSNAAASRDYEGSWMFPAAQPIG